MINFMMYNLHHLQLEKSSIWYNYKYVPYSLGQ